VAPRDQLSIDEVNEMAKCQSALMLAPTIDFYLDWADSLVEKRDADGLAKFGGVMSALVLVLRSSQHDLVVESERVIPAPAADNPIRILQRWSRAEFARRIAPRLSSLEARENDPKVTPTVRQAWGVEGKPGLLARLTSRSSTSRSTH
jgi:hypothetical protein